ncbi:TetR/AcrR family transcriptional regulator [Hoeflea sp. YIM 152468]|uniref:TetR/AcrR family transcriptional regulator n=1 Tax=Hoeflea sp. YIM 152468 TaxID=3031759 RepID=UPI0023DAB2DA|nr:TetR/AcrR family transcriptional regulator [Hoeflea sp. YIM 152468]MDF1607576.1 TetR/AcrR family transcriptional regulator [Hoeflea sp. YIM 152468]
MARRAGSNGAETAEKLRNAALELFARSGYAAVSMRAIAAKTGVQAGAIYNHFPTKQDLLNELLQVHMETLLEAWEEAEDLDLAPPQALEHFVRFHIRYHLDRSREVFISYMELRSLEEKNFRIIEQLRRSYETVPRAILERGAADGSFAIIDPQLTTMAIIAMLTGMTTWYRENGRLSLDEIEALYVRLVARLVGQKKED